MSDFHPLEFVGRGSEKQIWVGENINFKTWYINTYDADFFRLFFIHLKLELLTQFPASNDEK